MSTSRNILLLVFSGVLLACAVNTTPVDSASDAHDLEIARPVARVLLGGSAAAEAVGVVDSVINIAKSVVEAIGKAADASKDNRSKFVVEWMNRLGDEYLGYGVCVIKHDQYRITDGADKVITVEQDGHADFIKWHDRLTQKDIFFTALLVKDGDKATIKNTADGGYLNWACKGNGRCCENNEAVFS